MDPRAATDGRRFDLDWIRIGAFGLLILYHVGMFYVSWDWHVKSGHKVPEIEPLMRLTSPWRLALLFLVSGAATRFMCKKLDPAALAASRSVRLLVPLAFGVLVIVPPQSYFQVVEALNYQDGFFAFYARYLSADQSFGLILPTYNHLWFVAYLWVYTMLLAGLIAWRPKAANSLSQIADRALAGPGLLILPWAVLALSRMLMLTRFGETHALVDDWYNHVQYLTLFLLGFAIADNQALFRRLGAARWRFSAAWLVSYAALVIYFANATDATPDWLRQCQRFVWGGNEWFAIAAILGHGWVLRERRGVALDTPARRYLTEAIFPFYIIHQTTIVVVGHVIAPLALPAAIEAALLILATASSCILTYELARRSRVLRPLFGLKSEARAAFALQSQT